MYFNNKGICSREEKKKFSDDVSVCRQCLSPAKQVAFLSVRANKFAKWKTGCNCMASEKVGGVKSGF